MKQCAWIFARGGSKGVPGKNLRELGGLPLIGWSIKHAQDTNLFDRILVSTDDLDIARVSEQCGAEIPFIRPVELASDKAPEWLAWQHAAVWQSEYLPTTPGFVSLPATSPLRQPADIAAACAKRDQGYDLVLGVTESQHNPQFNMVRLDDAERVSLWDASGQATRRQDAPRAYNITTVVYATTVAYVESARGLLEGRVGGVTIPAERAVDIDTFLDLEWARFLMERA